MSHRARIAALALGLAVVAHTAAADGDMNVPSEQPSARREPARWHEQKTPAKGEPSAIGEYSAGCLRGAASLALDGAGYQVMHPSRLRYFGHPDLVSFVEGLGRAAHAQGLVSVLVGDLSQPRGGRATGGHASHQSGLDVDVWYAHPRQAQKRALTQGECESSSARSVLDGKTGAIATQWSARVEALLRITAADPRVTRVFVHPIIKRELCTRAEGDRAWLGKLRPWFGHDDHFHVRLACPSGSALCVPQEPQAAGDGCAELDYWFSDAARADREQGRKQYQGKVASTPKLPALCATLLERK